MMPMPKVVEAQPCAWCSEPFTPLRPNHRYCGNPCRNAGLADQARTLRRVPWEAVQARRAQQRERTEASLVEEFGPLSSRELAIAKRIWRLGYSAGYNRAYRKEPR